MPANPRSIRVTERYRAGMVRLRRTGQAEAKRVWQRVNPDDIDGTFDVGRLAISVAALQKEATRLSSAYLASYLTSELGEETRPPPLMVRTTTFNDNPLREGLRSAAIKAKVRIGEGMEPRDAVNASRATLVIDVGLFIDTSARESLRQGMEDDERITGYQRAIRGTCGACAGMSDGSTLPAGTPLEIHPDCQCVSEPRVRQPGSSGEAAVDIRNQIQHWLKPSADDLAAAEANWAKQLEGLVSTNPEARAIVSDAVAENQDSSLFQALIDKYGGGKDVIVVIDEAAARSNPLINLEGVGAAQRLGGTTFISDVAAAANPKLIAGALRHEFGHSLWEYVDDAIRVAFKERLGRLPRTTLANRSDRLEFTDYLIAWSRDDEAFCEAIRVVFSPDFDPTGYSQEFQEMAAWMRRTL